MPAFRLKLNPIQVWLVAAITCAALGLALVARFPYAAIAFVDVPCACAFFVSARGAEKWPARAFAASAIFLNLTSMIISVYLGTWASPALVILSILLVPPVLGFGAAWAASRWRTTRSRRLFALGASALVLALAFGPVSMLANRWPLHMAFFFSRPSLDQLANRVAAGAATPWPQRAGLIRVVGSATNPLTQTVGLITDKNSSGRAAFVRVGASANLPITDGPLFNLNVIEHLGGTWWYQEED
jgi:hypothetical protein